MNSVSTVFVDRDGVLNRKSRGYVLSVAQLRLLPGAAEALHLLNRAGKRVIVVTNQRCVALGLLTPDGLQDIHTALASLLRAEGAHVDGMYACVHGVGECDCRKPAPGLLLRAQRDHPEIDLRRSVLVGDSAADVRAGLAAGCQTVLVGRGRRYAAQLARLEQAGSPPTATARSLLDATRKHLL